MKSVAAEVVKEKRVSEMNAVTVELRAAEKADNKRIAHMVEAARVVATEGRKDKESAQDAHARLLKRAKAVVTADGVVLKAAIWDEFSRLLVLALAGDTKVTVKPAKGDAAKVESPASIALDKIADGSMPVRNVSKAVTEVRADWAGKPRPTPPASKGAQNNQTTKTTKPADAPIAFGADGEYPAPSKALLKHWFTHADELRKFKAALAELGWMPPEPATKTVTKAGERTITKHKPRASKAATAQPAA